MRERRYPEDYPRWKIPAVDRINYRLPIRWVRLWVPSRSAEALASKITAAAVDTSQFPGAMFIVGGLESTLKKDPAWFKLKEKDQRHQVSNQDKEILQRFGPPDFSTITSTGAYVFLFEGFSRVIVHRCTGGALLQNALNSKPGGNRLTKRLVMSHGVEKSGISLECRLSAESTSVEVRINMVKGIWQVSPTSR